jgi:hypothetical protein
LALSASCDLLPRPGDTTGVQTAGRWDQRARLVIDVDSVVTLVRLRVDTVGVAARHDVVLGRFEFEPSDAVGDEYALTLALDLGRADTLAPGREYRVGQGPGRLPAYATVTCVCGPVRPDSVAGVYQIDARGQRQISGRIDATLYFTAWGDTSRHVTYALRQRVFGVRP